VRPSALPGFAVANGRDVEADVIKAEHAGRLDKRGSVDTAQAGDAQLGAHGYQVHYALAECQQSPLSSTGHADDLLPDSDGPDRESVVADEAKDAVVAGLRSKAPESALPRLVKMGGVGALIEPFGLLHLPTLGGEKVAGLIATLEHLFSLSCQPQFDARPLPSEGRRFQRGEH
jgi:hypothetical protein